MRRRLLMPVANSIYWQLTSSSLPARQEENRSDDFSLQSVLESVGLRGISAFLDLIHSPMCYVLGFRRIWDM